MTLTITLNGPQGVGKSHTAREIRDMLEGLGLQVEMRDIGGDRDHDLDGLSCDCFECRVLAAPPGVVLTVTGERLPKDEAAQLVANRRNESECWDRVRSLTKECSDSRKFAVELTRALGWRTDFSEVDHPAPTTDLLAGVYKIIEARRRRTARVAELDAQLFAQLKENAKLTKDNAYLRSLRDALLEACGEWEADLEHISSNAYIDQQRARIDELRDIAGKKETK